MAKLFSKIDLLILIPSLLLSGFGLLMIYSISFESSPALFYRQLVYVVVGVGVFFLLAHLDFKTISHLSVFFYAFIVLLLIVTSFFGTRVQGSVRWIDLGFVTIQASEIAKPVIILFLADFFSRFSPKNFRSVVFSGLIVLVPVFLVFHQPDFGNAFLLLSIWIFMIFLGGVSLTYIVGSVIGFALFSPILWHFLKGYQKTRILSFLNLSSDPKGAGYNVVQALIAFGSGQIFGKGLGKGTQSHLNFLPAEKTDFIFAATGEELGFVGIAILIGIFSLLVGRLLKIASELGEKSASLLIYSVAFSLFLQFFINAGVNVGVIPVTGITLPFVSYGGSSLISVFAQLGLVQSAKNSQRSFDRDFTS